jgi:N-acyl-D-amino-acid deacylase
MSEQDVETVMRHENTLFGSDGLPTSGARPHPRLWGTFPRILGHYCRERGVLTVERAIEKMTRLAALRFGLADRGEIREGYFADLVLFDPETVAAGSSYENPTMPPTGIVGVWVNGVRVARDGVHTGARPGRALRYGRSRVQARFTDRASDAPSG